jgi:CRP-like cAMP-binding protein
LRRNTAPRRAGTQGGPRSRARTAPRRGTGPAIREKLVKGAPEYSTNRLIAALPASTRERWSTDLVPVELKLGQVLYEPHASLEHAYFPTTALISLLHVLRDGSTAEIAVVGREGMVGVWLFMGGGSTPSRGVVQGAGRALRLPRAVLVREFERGGPAAQVLLRYTQAMISQVAQTAACNRHHTIEQQLCRWLLLRLDRLAGAEVAMTQELIAGMLGVRREGVTVAAARLQRAGLIRYSRGHIRVLDRAALERCSCECYGVVRREYERLLPAVTGG